MKTGLYIYFLIICHITTIFSAYNINIEIPTDEDYQQSYTVMYQVGVMTTYQSLFEEILSEDQLRKLHVCSESTIFQPMWNNRYDKGHYFFVAKEYGKVIGMAYAMIDRDNFYNAITKESLILPMRNVLFS
jgi:hypothetical protein